jgi:GNAT superfamily N-acetyltransferase
MFQTANDLPLHSLREGAFEATTDRARLDFATIHELLVTRYWAKNTSREQIERQTRYSTFAFGLYQLEDLPALPEQTRSFKAPKWKQERERLPLLPEQAPRQVGFCRVVSDLTRFAYLADVVVAPQLQGFGLGKLLMRCVYSHPELIEVRLHCLRTDDAHNLYTQYGFRALGHPDLWMERKKLDSKWR